MPVDPMRLAQADQVVADVDAGLDLLISEARRSLNEGTDRTLVVGQIMLAAKIMRLIDPAQVEAAFDAAVTRLAEAGAR